MRGFTSILGLARAVVRLLLTPSLTQICHCTTVSTVVETSVSSATWIETINQVDELDELPLRLI